MASRSRTLYEVVPMGKDDGRRGFGWLLRVNGGYADMFATKQDAIAWARSTARESWEEFGEKAQLRVRTRSGRWQSESTFPDDTPRRKS